MAWPNGTVPSGYLECNGASLDRTTYADLFAVLSDDYGNVDGTHFNLPDLRGRFLRGWAHGQATDPDRASRTDRGDGITGDYVGTKQAYAFKSHSHVQNTPDGPGGTFTLQGSGAAGNRSDVSTQATGDSETRPININVMWIIKY
jgi:microcystin-dependent protein